MSFLSDLLACGLAGCVVGPNVYGKCSTQGACLCYAELAKQFMAASKMTSVN
jgi:hypothetical protein